MAVVLGIMTFIAIRSVPEGTGQVMAAAISAVISMIIYGEWKDFSNKAYIFAILLAISVFAIWALIYVTITFSKGSTQVSKPVK